MAKNWFYEYRVEVWYEDMGTNPPQVKHGVVPGATYLDAMNNLIHYYGDNSIVEVKLFATDEQTLYEFEYADDGGIFNIQISDRFKVPKY